ncbi:MAG: 30S ribosomal protein S11 [Spirochaetes bacterium]|jgi:small subunit ribosomal protein S11|nr:30S ribosomal protein S11 [Spirochaetota bacterium]
MANQPEKEKDAAEPKKEGAAAPKKKIKRHVAQGIVHVQNTFNNTIVTVTDLTGNVISWASAGHLKFRGAKKSTPFASQVTAAAAMENAVKAGLREVKVFVKGPGFGRESAIRAIARSGVRIALIKDVTGVPHNGCRPRKIRRI